MQSKKVGAPVSMDMFDTVEASNRGFRIELETATGSKSGVFVTVLGPDSEEYRKAEKKIRDEQQNKLRRRKNIDIETDAISLLAHSITSWENMPGYGDYSYAQGVEVLTKYPAIRRQIEREQSDLTNFIQG